LLIFDSFKLYGHEIVGENAFSPTIS